MKTPLEFLASIGSFDFSQLARSAIELRDAGHAAEFKAREEALRATIERLGKELADMADELAEASDIIDDAMEHCGDVDQKRARKFLEAAPSPAESTGVPETCVCGVRIVAGYHRRGCPTQPAAAPDDIRERLEALTKLVVSLAQNSPTQGAMVDAQNRIEDHERRLKALEERYDVLSKWNGALAKMAE